MPFKMFIALVLLGLSSVCIAPSEGADILAMFPFPFYSHTNTFKPILRELANRGHKITFVSPYPEKNKPDTWVDIVIPNTYAELVAEITPDMFVKKSEGWTDAIGFIFMGQAMLKVMFKEPTFLNFLQDQSLKFDLVLVETFFLQEFMVALGHKYKCPVVNLNPAEPFFLASSYTGNLEPYSYVPNPNIPNPGRLSFYERFKNTILQGSLKLIGELLYLPMQESWMRAYMNETNGFSNLPPLKKMLTNTSLTLIDYHFSVGSHRPLHSNMISVGGLTLKDAGPLPKDLQKIMDESPHGVVFFSFGSHFNASLLPEKVQQDIIGALTKLKQTVIMKWPTDIPNAPKNVLVSNWWPQPSILAHPKCVAFVSHVGLHGLYETLNVGVPIVGIPIFGDQIRNIIRAEAEGYGIYIDRHDNISEEIICNAITKVIEDPSYKAKAVAKSKLIMDRPLPPLQEGVFWIEYVLRHKGAYHMRPASLDLPLYQYLLLDVTAIIGGIVIVEIAILTIILKLCCRMCSKSKIESKKNVKAKGKKDN